MPMLHAQNIYLGFISILLLCNGIIEASDGLETDSINPVECQLGRALRKQVKPTPLGGMCLKDIVIRLSKTLRSIGNDELGLVQFQRMLDQLDFIQVPDEPDSSLKTLVNDIDSQLEKFLDILERSLDIVAPVIKINTYDHSYLDHSQELQVQRLKSGDFCKQIEDALAFNLKDSGWKHLRVIPIKRPGKICGQAGPVRNIGSLFLSQCDKPRNVIVLLENGMFMSEEDIALARATARTIVDMLSDGDLITVIGLADKSSIYCTDTLVKATDVNKYQLIRRIDSIVRLDANESSSVDFKFITKSLHDDIVIVHITNTFKDLSNVKNIVNIIASNKLKVYFRTALIVSDLKPSVNVEETFINESTATLPTNNPLGYDIARLFANLQCPIINRKYFYLSDIFLQPYGKTLGVSIVRATDDVLISLDVKLREFVEKITYFNAGFNNNAVLFDKKGLVWMHKNFPRIETLSEQPIKVYFHDIENIEKDFVVEMIETPAGVRELTNKLNETITVRWKHLKYLDLIVCIITDYKNNVRRSVAKFPPPLPDNILHHRLDLVSQTLADSVELCLDRRSIVSPRSAVMYLSPWCLNSWREDLASLMNLQSYMAYIKDATRLLRNPGLGPFVRRDAAMLAQIIDHWKERHDKSPSKMFILRRYVAAVESGVAEVYPGLAMDSSLDPRRRAWYGKAIDHPGKIILTSSYLDGGGAGYVVSLSQTIYEGRRSTIHTQQDPVVAVASMDFTLGFVVRLIRDMLPFCNESMIKCFLMDDKGYLVFHPSLLEPAGKLEQQHLTHKELLVANDILNHEFFVKKKICANFLDGTIERYYQFNTSLEEVLTNIIHGEHCVKYQLAAVPDTNLFFGVVNETCTLPAFCPCNTMARSCLNCKRMEQTECECPCECSLYSSGCEPTNISNIEPCRPPYEQGIVPTTRWDRVTVPEQLNLQQCPSSDCKAYGTESECLGIVGCQWCSVDIDGETTLVHPFCSDINLCFKGVLGAILPYADGTYNSQSTGDSIGKEWPSVGPVAGGILAIVLIFGVVLFCYRLHSVQSGLEHQCLHLHGSPDTLRMTHLDVGLGGSTDGDPVELDRSKNHLDSLLHESTPPISPYRVSTNYRRPPGGDSDHGYSTMTPHDDTEQQSFAEPLLLINATMEPEDDRPVIRPPSPTTRLESPHRVLVPVTVHRNMETNYC
ncbi:VWFA and cache domain-containing protein 1 [Microplitis mediator]|uniref:VWFA and cache domain-containing protein 1 n=1 Tax=Microplitis mediator TaxID=375433 RepID=UPI0025568ABE|nr:VWFA and cache domain-containing protein 1 [Microplitis mediator]